VRHEVAACSVLQQLQSERVGRCISSHELRTTNNRIEWLIDCKWVWGLTAPKHLGLNNRINTSQPRGEPEGNLLTFDQRLYYTQTTVQICLRIRWFSIRGSSYPRFIVAPQKIEN
jgi:hypothetical protein